jgi:hypothetical protein
MKTMKKTIFTILCVMSFVSVVHAKDNALKGVKLGFGFDRDFGIVGSVGKLNGFIGNDGVSVDYIFIKDKLATEIDWYVGAGGYSDWNGGDTGVRLPVGAELRFSHRLDAFAQLMPRLRVNRSAKFGIDAAIGVRYRF